MTHIHHLADLRKIASNSTETSEGDIFDRQLNSFDESKTIKILNLIYSLIAGVLSARTTRRFISQHKLVGILIAVISYAISRKFLRINANG